MNTPANSQDRPLRVVVAGGGPVGLSFALSLKSLMGERASITVYDGRWHDDGNGKLEWSGIYQGNARRQQVVTIQSRQYSKLPTAVISAIFSKGAFTEMWPKGPDSPDALGAPRNVRIAHIEDALLSLAQSSNILLSPRRFDAQEVDVTGEHALIIADGAASRTREHFIQRFGQPDAASYSVNGQQLVDVVLGLRVKSTLSDPLAVVLTISQNRFLLNSLSGDGFLNMRLAPDEVSEVVGINRTEGAYVDCIQAHPCLMERSVDGGEYKCSTHGSVFKPSLDATSFLWPRIQEGLRLFGVKESNFSGVTAFRLSMVQRPRFTARLYGRAKGTPGTFGFLLGDAANAIHFWPGRGLNSGLAAAVSLARCLAAKWGGRSLRDADFLRHEAVMHMLQYRHKTRAWSAMVTSDDEGRIVPVQDMIRAGLRGGLDRKAYEDIFLSRLLDASSRLSDRLTGVPKRTELEKIVSQLSDSTLKVLVASRPWETRTVSGEEVDIDLLLESSSDGALQRRTTPIMSEAGATAPSERELVQQGPKSSIWNIFGRPPPA
jgi:hypothetical protein